MTFPSGPRCIFLAPLGRSWHIDPNWSKEHPFKCNTTTQNQYPFREKITFKCLKNDLKVGWSSIAGPCIWLVFMWPVFVVSTTNRRMPFNVAQGCKIVSKLDSTAVTLWTHTGTFWKFSNFQTWEWGWIHFVAICHSKFILSCEYTKFNTNPKVIKC